MQRFWAFLISLVIICAGYFYSANLQYEKQDNPEILTKAIVLDVKEMAPAGGEKNNPALPEKQWAVRLKITEGFYKGRLIDTVHYQDSNPAYDFMVKPGDKVVVSLDVEDFVLKEAYISSLARDNYLWLLVFIFSVSILAIGLKQGFKTLLSLIITCLAVFKILLPAILAGKNPITVSILICTGVTIITHMLITGFSKKSLAAITGTVIGLVLGGGLAKYVIVLTRVNGLNSEESQMLYYSFTRGNLDVTGLLFAGIIIGALGAVMDVAMSIASSISEMNELNPELTFRHLFQSGMNVGKDIIGTMANTLILAYTGSSLPLMLLLMANNVPYLKFINLDMIAVEIIRALAGSIGLFLAVPFTALISAFLCKKKMGKMERTFLDT
jgi:uncharacterized membrane protein